MKKLKSPYVVLRDLNRHQWLMFWVGFAGWTWDSFDFFTVSLTVTELAADFDAANSDVSWVGSSSSSTVYPRFRHSHC